jgi:hypothetical protein
MNKRWKVILAFVGVFGAGVLVGNLSTKCSVSPPPIKQDKPREEFEIKVMRRYIERLQLSDEQVEQIRPIVVKASQDMKGVRTVWFRDTRELAERMNQDVAALLTAEQKIEFEKYNQELKERWKKMSHRKSDSKKKRPPPPHKE